MKWLRASWRVANFASQWTQTIAKGNLRGSVCGRLALPLGGGGGGGGGDNGGSSSAGNSLWLSSI